MTASNDKPKWQRLKAAAQQLFWSGEAIAELAEEIRVEQEMVASMIDAAERIHELQAAMYKLTAVLEKRELKRAREQANVVPLRKG
jgi:hypothetical protein